MNIIDVSRKKGEKMELKKSESQYKMDMLSGSLWNKLIAFAFPLAITSILQQLFNSADVAVVGRFVGSDALAAVGANVSNVGIFVNFLVGFSVGPNVVLSRLIGRGDENEAKKIPGTTIALSLFIGLLFFACGELLTRWLLVSISTPEKVLEQAVLYSRIYLIGIPFLSIYNCGSALLRSVGDTKRPLYILIGSGILNVVLNLVFVIIFGMGVSGVAVATVISEILSCFAVILILIHEKGILHLGKNFFHPDFKYVGSIFVQGFPSGVQNAVFSVSNMFVQAGINSFGSAAIAGSSAGLNFEYFTYAISAAFSQGVVTFVSQNFGAAQIRRCKRVFWIALGEGAIFTWLLGAIFIIWRHFFVSFYTIDPAVQDFAIRRMLYVTSVEFLACPFDIGSGALRGIGHTVIPSLFTVLGTVVFRIIWLYTVFAHFKSYETLMIVYPVSWVFTEILVLIAYFYYMKKLERQIEN